MQKKIISADIGEERILLAYANKAGVRRPSNSYSIIDTPADSVKNGEITDPHAVATAIMLELSRRRIRPREIMFCLDPAAVTVRVVELGNVRQRELRAALTFELSQTYPEIESEAVVSYKVLYSKGTSHTCYAAYAANSVLEGYHAVAEFMGAPVTAIDARYNAMLKSAVLINHAITEESAVIINIGERSSDLLLLSGGVTTICRPVNAGVAALDSVVSERAGVPIEQARAARMEGSYAPFGYGWDEMLMILRYGLAALEQDLRQTVEFYNNRNTDRPVKKLYLIGEAGLFEYIREFFRDSLPLEIVRLDTRWLMPAYKWQDADLMLPAVGTLLGRRQGEDINLLPEDPEGRQKRVYSTLATVAAIIAVAMLPLYYFITFNLNTRNTSVEDRNKELAAEITAIDREIMSSSGIRHILIQNKELSSVVDLPDTLGADAGRRFAQVGAMLLPSGVTLMGFELDSEDLIIQAISHDRAGAAALCAVLGEMEGATSVTLLSLGEAEGGCVFSVSVSFTVIEEAGDDDENE